MSAQSEQHRESHWALLNADLQMVEHCKFTHWSNFLFFFSHLYMEAIIENLQPVSVEWPVFEKTLLLDEMCIMVNKNNIYSKCKNLSELFPFPFCWCFVQEINQKHDLNVVAFYSSRPELMGRAGISGDSYFFLSSPLMRQTSGLCCCLTMHALVGSNRTRQQSRGKRQHAEYSYHVLFLFYFSNFTYWQRCLSPGSYNALLTQPMKDVLYLFVNLADRQIKIPFSTD